jgi:hypothetical protein
MKTLTDRASAYVASMPPAVAGNRGHDATFAVALALCHGFALSKSQAFPLMLEFNARCDPPWSENELELKLDSAGKATRHSKPRGHLLGERGPRQPVSASTFKSSATLTIIEVDTSEPLPAQLGNTHPPARPRSALGESPLQIRPKKKIPLCFDASLDTEASQAETLSAENEAEARRIAAELVRLYRDGAIRTRSADDPEAVFYATLLRDFGGTYISRKDPAKTN